ncbi:glycosyltransferase [Lacinutrix sp. Bg11-31]|uniref:glycosyltransferase family 2 protein n=1 Tax=Lacinutrix sp. Bg11-31 TaxID=2057808 RepID=UPI000C30F3DC|nr:glycosyltransferase [Lacinutrix sp. Bg11-31]AUC82575.1 glycosyltransferase [Lacinutrix sp. Bg11-31]
MILLFTVITILYLLLILVLAFGFDKVDYFKAEDLKAETKLSVIIPFRNEAKNLPELLASIEVLNYPKSHYELIFVDDESSDDSVEIISKVNDIIPSLFGITLTDIKIINNVRTSKSPKKDAITLAIKIAKYDWIVTTDADCVLPKFWLDTLDCFIQKKQCKMVVAPVTYHQTDSLLKRFQLLDFLSLIGATIGGFGIGKPFLCNGANLAYKKELFLDLNGFNGNNEIASGDDIFLLQKTIKNNKSDVKFLKSESAIVKTKAQPTLKTLISQRKRWAAKTSSYNSTFGKVVGLIVLLMNAVLVCGLTFVLLGLLHFKLILYIFIIKSLVDFLLLFKTARFFDQENQLSSFIFSIFLYPFFSVYIAFISLFTKYKWKDRSFSK